MFLKNIIEGSVLGPKILSPALIGGLHGIDLVILILLALIIVGIIRSLVRNKKKGGGCYGCPNCGCCSRMQEEKDSSCPHCSSSKNINLYEQKNLKEKNRMAKESDH